MAVDSVENEVVPHLSQLCKTSIYTGRFQCLHDACGHPGEGYLEIHLEHVPGNIHRDDRGSTAHAGQIHCADAGLEFEVPDDSCRERGRRVEGCAVDD